MSRLTFTPGNHGYYLADPDTEKKTRVTSVTTLLGLLAKPALVKWAARSAADYAVDNWDSLAGMSLSERQKVIASAPDLAKNTAAAKGTAIHDLAERMIAGEPVEVADDLLPKVEGLARWLERQTFKVVATERVVWSDEDDELGLCAYAGKFDALVECPRRGLGLLDWKTGSGVYGDMGVQLVGYRSAEVHVIDDQDKPAPRIQWAGIVHVRADGSDLHTLDADSLAAAGTRFELLRALKYVPFPNFQQEAS
jgi:hypothetical protein